MTASVRGLVALAVLALALLIASLVGARATQRLDDHAVLASFDPAQVQSISWSGAPPLVVARSGQGWRFPNDPMTPVITRSVEDVLSSLRSARWHRRAEPARLGTVRRTLTLSLGALHHVIDLGAPLAGTDQSWIAVDHGDALLVDNWLVALLDPTALVFRDRTPLAATANATSIVVHGAHELELSGPPWRVRGMLVDPALVAELTGTLAKLSLVTIELPAPAAMTTIVIDHLPSVSIGGACPGGGVAVIAFSAKPACTDAASAADVFRAIDALAGAPVDIIDRRPAGFAVTSIELPDGTVALGKHATVTVRGVAHPADPDRIAELLHALAEPGQPVAPAGSPAFTITIPPITLDVFGGLAVQRRGEPLALIVSPAARELLARPARLLVDAERWSEEPTTITTISIDGVTYQRGVVLGEWSRTPAAKSDPTLVEALAEAVAKLHAPARTGTAATPHHLVVTVAPPIGATVTHAIELGSPTADGCPAVIAGEPVTAPLALCVAVASLAH